jgi:SAM-dependent methyltransferase
LPEKPQSQADDPPNGRQPTSHERMSGRLWDASYHHGPAPWDIGHPQPAIVRVASAGGFVGTVLDAGCGTGENALHLASLGFPVLGVDVAETAIAIARQKVRERTTASGINHAALNVEFEVADAFHLDRLGRKFETVLDCGLFHTFDGAGDSDGEDGDRDHGERPAYVASLASVTEPRGILYVLCFSDEGPDTGPHPVSEEGLRAAFTPTSGWNIAAIEPDRIHTNFHGDKGAPAWLATIKRIGNG